jgi:hypothetical protein
LRKKDRHVFTLVMSFYCGGKNQWCGSGSGALLTLGSGMGKISGSRMNNPNYISKSLETIFWVSKLKFFDADPRSGMEKIRIRDKHPGSAKLGKMRQ